MHLKLVPIAASFPVLIILVMNTVEPISIELFSMFSYFLLVNYFRFMVQVVAVLKEFDVKIVF